MKRFLPFLIILVVLGAAVFGVWYLQRPTDQPPTVGAGIALTAPPVANAPPSANNPSSDKPVPASADLGAEPPHALGSANAPVTLEEFGDFECPPCGMLHPILKTMEAEFGPAKLRLIFREFPLVPNHQHALSAARAAEAAGLQGKFWEMHGMIYEHQKDWHEAFDVRPIFEGYATKIGLDVAQFRRDSTNEIVERRIFLDGKRAHGLGVKGTPTVFLNGREVPFESLEPTKLRALINAELAARP